MQIVTKSEIVSALDLDNALKAIRSGFEQYSQGKARVAIVSHLGFDAPPGDCHVKTGHIGEDDIFVIKVATGFYDNAALGLSPNNGMMLVMSARSGEPLAVLQDEGLLTDVRTALAGVLATKACQTSKITALGIIGTGVQADLQTRYLARFANIPEVHLWGRSNSRAAALASRLKNDLEIPVQTHRSPETLCQQVNTIITTTASQRPILKNEWIQPGTHITAVGADAPGKQELDSEIFVRASAIVADSIDQCVDHGETASAVEAKLIGKNNLLELGHVLSQGGLSNRNQQEITIADLTGVAVQDVQIAKSIWHQISP